MIITAIRTRSAGPYLFTEVETDKGFVGIGESGDWAHLGAVEAQIEQLAEYFLGKDPRNIEYHWQYVQKSTFFRSSVLLSALSAIDIALWDIKGQALGVPVYEFFGGSVRSKVRSYAHAKGETPDEIAEACVKVRELGFDAARIILPSFRSNLLEPVDHVYSHRINLAIDKVLACRDAVGPNFDLCVEAHRAYSVSEAIAIGKGIEEAQPLFFEDPISPDNLNAMAKVAASTNVPIATGERAVSVAEFAALLNAGVRVLRPDVCTIGGLTPASKVSALAEGAEAHIAPHNPLGPVSTAACLQIDLASSSFLIQEYPTFNLNGTEDTLVVEPLISERGYIEGPTAAGIGVRLADDIEQRFPIQRRNLVPAVGYDGSPVPR